MLHEQQSPTDLEHAPHVHESSPDLGNAAAGPRHDDRVHAAVRQRDAFGGTFEEAEGNFHVRRLALGSRQQRRRRIESEDFADLSRIEGKIKSGADADVKDAPFGCARDALAIRTKPLVAHREIDEWRQNPFFIEAHRRAPEIPRSRSIRILFGRAEPSPMLKLPPHERTLSVPRTPLTKLAAPKPLRIAMKAEQDRTGTAREA